MVRAKRTAPTLVDPNHPLIDLIPPKRALDMYKGRKIAGVADLDILEAAMEARHNVAVFGPTGSAKTSMIYAFGAKMGLPVFSVPCNGAADPSFLFGGWQPNETGNWHLSPGPVYYVARYGGILYLDEYNMMPPRIGAVLHSPLDSRRTMTIPEFASEVEHLDAAGNPIVPVFKLHKYCFIIAAWNPKYSGTFEVNEAAFNRFGIKLEFDYLVSVETEMINSPALMNLAARLRNQYNSGDLTSPVTTNMLLEFEEFALNEALGVPFACVNFANAFPPNERSAVLEVMKNFKDDIAAELAALEFEDEAEVDLDEALVQPEPVVQRRSSKK